MPSLRGRLAIPGKIASRGTDAEGRIAMPRHLITSVAAVVLIVGITPGAVPHDGVAAAVQAAAAVPGQSIAQVEPARGRLRRGTLLFLRTVLEQASRDHRA